MKTTPSTDMVEARVYSTSRKGKAKETEDDDSSASPPQQRDKSLTSRVISSATGLAKDAVGSSNGHVPAALSSSSALGGKLQSSGTSSGPSAWADTLSVRPGESINRNGTAGQSESPSLSQSIRTQPSQSSAARDFEQFMLSNTAESLHSDDFQSSTSAERFEFHGVIDEPYQPTNGLAARSSQYDQINFDHSDPYDDGAEVRLLLSDPTFNAMTDTFEVMKTEEPSQATVDELFPQSFTTEEQDVVDYMRSNVAAPPVHKAMHPDHPLNLRPLSDEEKESLQKRIREFDSRFNGMERRTSFSTDSEREDWIADWDAVLSGYADEVWGNLLPAIQAAKSALEEVRAGATTVDTQAIARLKMILGHVNAQPTAMGSIFSPQENAQDVIEQEEDRELPIFHCPWVSCHEHFKDEWELHAHTGSHRTYRCPHTDCSVDFEYKSLAEWKEHIRTAHHHLLETSTEMDSESN